MFLEEVLWNKSTLEKTIESCNPVKNELGSCEYSDLPVLGKKVYWLSGSTSPVFNDMSYLLRKEHFSHIKKIELGSCIILTLCSWAKSILALFTNFLMTSSSMFDIVLS